MNFNGKGMYRKFLSLSLPRLRQSTATTLMACRMSPHNYTAPQALKILPATPPTIIQRAYVSGSSEHKIALLDKLKEVDTPVDLINYLIDLLTIIPLEESAGAFGVTGVSILVTYNHQHLALLQKIQAEFTRLHAEVNKLLPEIMSCYSQAYSVTKKRLNQNYD